MQTANQDHFKLFFLDFKLVNYPNCHLSQLTACPAHDRLGLRVAVPAVSKTFKTKGGSNG